MYWRIIIPEFLVHAFNLKSILCFVNYMIIINIHNRMPKSGILFTVACIGDFFNRHNFMKHWVKVIYVLLLIFVSKRRRPNDCERSRARVPKASTRSADKLISQFSWTMRIICYVKVWKYIIAICSLVLCRGFLIRCAILLLFYLYMKEAKKTCRIDAISWTWYPKWLGYPSNSNYEK